MNKILKTLTAAAALLVITGAAPYPLEAAQPATNTIYGLVQCVYSGPMDYPPKPDRYECEVIALARNLAICEDQRTYVLKNMNMVLRGDRGDEQVRSNNLRTKYTCMQKTVPAWTQSQ